MDRANGRVGPVAPTNLVEQGQMLLDFNQRLDITLLDSIVDVMYQGEGANQRTAQEILTSLKEHPDAWTRVDAILEFSKNEQTKYYALQILENLIKVRWKVLPVNQRDGIKKYIIGLIIKTSSNPELMEKERVYLNKLNMILVQILKREWPTNWPNFIRELIDASRENDCLFQNNFVILKLLSEEVFDYSHGEMTQAKARHLKDNLCSEFTEIFTLCQFVLQESQNPALIQACITTLHRFLNWIPLNYVFDAELITMLVYKFFVVDVFRNSTLQCLTEIAGIECPSEYDSKLVVMFTITIKQLELMLPPNTDIREAYANGADEEQKFVQNLSLFLSTFLRKHGHLLENSEEHHCILASALNGLILISEVDEVEIFKICLEYWNTLTADLYRENPFNIRPLTLGSPRRGLYDEVLSKLRCIMIGRMAKPEEVLVVENDQGEVVREFMKDTDSIQLYKNMRETLVYLTHLNCEDTERIMTDKLQRQVDGTEWSWKNLNTLCWAVGSISGAMTEEDERRFLVTVIKDLLGLCEQKRGKDNKAIIASNIMYVVGQYPRFLRAHWKFLKTVVNKLFEFMHEMHEGVQDMACDTFIKIAQKCKRHFVQIQAGETKPFIEEILSTINTIICDLQPQQVHTFYEAVGHMISSQSDAAVQERLIEKYMSLPNAIWDDVINQASKNVDILKDPEAVKQLGNILKTNVRACKALGHPYVAQLARIYLDMLNLYKVMSENISQAIALNGESVTHTMLIRQMRTVKKEILKLISGWVSRSNDHKMVLENFIPHLLEAVLLDYRNCTVPAARESEVLSTMSTIVGTLTSFITPQIPKIFDAVFECTLSMINKDFHEFPDHRTNFYLMLQQVVTHCFPALLTIPPAQFKLVLDSIIWAIKHTMRNVADTGLSILAKLLMTISQDEVAMQSFFQTFYSELMQHLFAVVTDSSQTAGLSQQASILSLLFYLVESGKITVPLNPAVQTIPADNVTYVQTFVANLLKTAFPHLTDPQIKITVQGFFNLDQNPQGFKEHLRDFLVQIREFSGADDGDLFLEEREAALRKAESEKRAYSLTVPGILNPHEREEEMQE